ncbi:MAG TPA: VOC family protein [Stenotrophomonas sp.]|nr:VOC family protein [Stenotrophomonas sp.]
MSPSAAPKLQGLLETALYAADLALARRFYEDVLGLRSMVADSRLAAYAVAPAQVLLLFQAGATAATVELPGGTIPGHDGSGRVHFAFAIAADDLPGWEAHLLACDIAVEGRTAWPQGGHSLYFRDPDQHLVELATPGLWRNY